MLHSEILSSLAERFDRAVRAGDLLFFPSTVVKHVDLDVEYEIRLCPALQRKPGPADTASSRQLEKEFDPFAPPYNVNLFIADLTDEESKEEFVILLNKFSVVPHHFLLVTKEFKPQSSPLTPSELVQTYLFLSSAREEGRTYFAFYNCGTNSGASQPHKHIQFIPLENGDKNGPSIESLARKAQLEFQDRPFSLTQLSYASHSYRFPSRINSYSLEQLNEVLSTAFLQLLDLAISTIRHDPNYPTGRPSYNVIITLEHMHIIPRRTKSYIIPGTGDEVSVNALGFAGMLLVKSEKELEAVVKEGVNNILLGVSLESVHDIQVQGTSQEPEL